MSLPHILLVEDNPHDALLTIKAVEDLPAYTLTAVEDGVEALAYLQCREPYTNASPPQLILLDLKLPRKSGLELLTELKHDVQLKHIPVVLLTNASLESGVLRRCAIYASAYIEKPTDPVQFVAVIRATIQSWLDKVVQPA